MLEDELLKWQFKQGSSKALCRIYEKYQDYLLTLAISLLNDVNSAEDVLHDVFVNFAESGKKFKLHGSLKHYLSTCIINRVRDRFRRKKSQPMILEADERISSPEKESWEKVVNDEESMMLNLAMAKLPYEQKEAVTLRLKAGMKFKQIAKLQNVSVGTVQGRYRYGLEKLRSKLDGEVNK